MGGDCFWCGWKRKEHIRSRMSFLPPNNHLLLLLLAVLYLVFIPSSFFPLI
jgi:hypothetical protein